jgi:hypothetical protein
MTTEAVSLFLALLAVLAQMAVLTADILAAGGRKRPSRRSARRP